MTKQQPNTGMNFLQTHALSLRRAVPGRRKPFDELLAEHKARVNCEKEQLQQNQALKLQEQAVHATLKRSTSTSDASVTSTGSSRCVEFAFRVVDLHVLNVTLKVPTCVRRLLT